MGKAAIMDMSIDKSWKDFIEKDLWDLLYINCALTKLDQVVSSANIQSHLSMYDPSKYDLHYLTFVAISGMSCMPFV